MSVFLAGIYTFFGIENRVAIFLLQGLLYLLSVLLFAKALRQISSERVALLATVLLLTFPAVFHTIFSVYRENLALSIQLLLASAYIRWMQRPSWKAAIVTGVLSGVLILTYIPFLFFPVAFIPLVVLQRLPKRYLAALVLIPYAIVGLWGLRNMQATGAFMLTGGERTAIMWHVRGEQAEHVRGLEPFKCLWAEYISRDWSERSEYCSFNGIMHRLWEEQPNADPAQVAAEGKEKILRYLPSYLWFSFVDIIELHLPYVNGWGMLYNALAALGSLIVYVGFLLGIPKALLDRRFAYFFLLMLYSTLIFVLTDATPRYLIPTIFCYIAVAAVGFNRLFKRASS
jgi:4-amino-4-deoxy-L-arabinose transferase-like glycosyltransferase